MVTNLYSPASFYQNAATFFTGRPRYLAPSISFLSDIHEYQAYPLKKFYICGDSLDEPTATFWLKPRTGGGSDVQLTVSGARTADYVQVQIPASTTTGIVYDVYVASRFGNSSLCTGNFHPGTGGKAWAYVGITVNAFTTGSTPDDPYNCQQWWGLNNGGKKLGNSQNVVNLQTGKFSTDGGTTWSGGTIGGNWSSGETLMNGATNTVWNLTFGGSGASQLKMDINGTTYTSTTSFDTSTLSAANLLATIKTLTNGSKIPFADRTSPITRTASTAQVTVSGSGTGPYTITLVDGWAGIMPRSAGANSAWAIASGTSTITVNTLTTHGTATDWTKNLRACKDYITTNWAGSGGGVIYIPAGYYLMDTTGSHAGKDGGATYTMAVSSWTAITFKGDGPQQSVLVYGNMFDDRDTYHQAGTSDMFLSSSGAIDGWGMCDLGLICNNGSAIWHTHLWRHNGGLIHMLWNNCSVGGPGWIGNSPTDPTITSGYSHVYRNCRFNQNGGYNTQATIEGNTAGQGFRQRCWDHLTVDGCTFTWRRLRWYLAQMTNSACVTRSKFYQDNPLTRLYPSVSVESGGVETSFGTNLLFAMNTVENVSSATLGTGQMEGMLTQQSSVSSTAYSNKGVTSNSGTSLVLSAQLYAGAQTPNGIGQNTTLRSIDSGTTQEWNYIVYVISGTGAGQWRWLTGVSTTTNTNDTLALAKAFTTTLDATSKVSVFVPTNAMQYWCDNVYTGWTYISQYDGAMAHRCSRNRFFDCGGILSISTLQQGVNKIAPLSNVQIDSNLFYSNGVMPTCAQVFYGYASPGTYTTTDLGTAGAMAYKVAVTNNQVYSGGVNPNGYSAAMKYDGFFKTIQGGGNFASATIADIESGSPSVFVQANYLNDAASAVNTTQNAGTGVTKPTYSAYGYVRASDATFSSATGNAAAVRDPASTLGSSATYTDPGGLLVTAAPA